MRSSPRKIQHNTINHVFKILDQLQLFFQSTGESPTPKRKSKSGMWLTTVASYSSLKEIILIINSCMD